MHILKVCLIVEPSDYFVAVQFGGLYRNTAQITAPRIFHGVTAKTVMNRVVMNVKDYLFQISFVVDQFSFKRSFEQTAVATGTFVESLRIRIK